MADSYTKEQRSEYNRRYNAEKKTKSVKKESRKDIAKWYASLEDELEDKAKKQIVIDWKLRMNARFKALTSSKLHHKKDNKDFS